MFKILLKQFIQRTGRKPNAIETLQLKFKAAEQAGKGKVIEFPRDKITDWRTPRPTEGKSAGITNIGKKAETAKKMEEDKFVADFMANADRVYYRFVSDTLAKVQNASKDEQLKIAKDIINRKGMYRNLDEQDAGKILKIIDQNIKPVEPKAYGGLAGMLGEPTYADGGRTGFKNGTKFDPTKRTFLKGLGALAALPVIGKFFKFAKPLAKSSKVLTQVPIKDISGMPAWFKPLVNKVIKEGDDVSKRFATQERQVVHQSTLPDSKTDVIVTQNLDTGHVSVDVGMGKHGFAEGHLGQPVRLEYKAAEDIIPDLKTGKGGGKTKEEFWVEEAEFTGGHPENVKFEESTFEKFGDHGSNFDEVEMFATGKVKKKTAKESIKAERAHWVPEGDDMASGGRVSLSSGGLAGMLGE